MTKCIKAPAIRLAIDYQARLDSLLQDGFLVRFESRATKRWFTKLVHVSNGNEITLNVDFVACSLTQKTNGKTTHANQYQ